MRKKKRLGVEMAYKTCNAGSAGIGFFCTYFIILLMSLPVSGLIFLMYACAYVLLKTFERRRAKVLLLLQYYDSSIIATVSPYGLA